MTARIGMHGRGSTLAESQENARRTENAGLDSYWVGEGSYDSFVHAAAIACATERIGVGTAVSLLTRTPAQAAQGCTGLDMLSGGRFTLGLGVGPEDWNRNWHGLDPARPAKRMAEYVQTFKAAWRSTPEQPAAFSGEIFSISDYRRVRRGPTDEMPVLIGVVGPLSTRNAGQFADGIIADIEIPLPYVRDLMLPKLKEGADRAGRDFASLTRGGLMACSVDPDGAVARQRAKHNILVHVPTYYYDPVWEFAGFAKEAAASREALAKGDLQGALDAIPVEMVEICCIAGTPDEVRKQVADWSEVLDLMIMSVPQNRLPAEEANWAFTQALECFAT